MELSAIFTDSPKRSRYARDPWRVILLLLLLLGIASVHWVLPVSPHVFHAAHIVFRKLFVVPIVLGGAWFGMRGAVAAAVISTALYAPHVVMDWSGQVGENLNQSTDVALFWLVGLLAGWLFQREHAARRNAEQAHQGTLEALAAALDAREHETDCHSVRVAELAVRVGVYIGIHEDELRVLREAARLHDVGKIGIPDRVLLKPGPLTDRERQLMQRHAEIGSKIVGSLPSLRAAAELILCHHERFDGTGYPRQLKGREIPLAAKVFSIADVYDALTSDRPYRAALSQQEALSMIRAQAGHAFDPEVVDAFETVLLESEDSKPQQTGEGQALL
jgi:hypothetical protein